MPSNKAMERTYTYEIFADYYQFYLQDEPVQGDLGDSWTEEAVERLLAIDPGTIGVGTVRNMNVPVVVEIADQAPCDDVADWDQVNECSLDVSSGRIVIAGCTDYFPDAARIVLPPGSYRARVYYRGLNSLSDDGLEGDDHYRVVLWPAPPGPLSVIKQRKEHGA